MSARLVQSRRPAARSLPRPAAATRGSLRPGRSDASRGPSSAVKHRDPERRSPRRWGDGSAGAGECGAPSWLRLPPTACRRCTRGRARCVPTSSIVASSRRTSVFRSDNVPSSATRPGPAPACDHRAGPPGAAPSRAIRPRRAAAPSPPGSRPRSRRRLLRGAVGSSQPTPSFDEDDRASAFLRVTQTRINGAGVGRSTPQHWLKRLIIGVTVRVHHRLARSHDPRLQPAETLWVVDLRRAFLIVLAIPLLLGNDPRQLYPLVDPELVEDLTQVEVDRVVRHEQARRRLLICQSGRDQRRDTELRGAETAPSHALPLSPAGAAGARASSSVPATSRMIAPTVRDPNRTGSHSAVTCVPPVKRSDSGRCLRGSMFRFAHSHNTGAVCCFDELRRGGVGEHHVLVHSHDCAGAHRRARTKCSSSTRSAGHASSTSWPSISRAMWHATAASTRWCLRARTQVPRHPRADRYVVDDRRGRERHAGKRVRQCSGPRTMIGAAHAMAVPNPFVPR